MNHYFEDIKQHYSKTAKALGITADTDYEEWCEESHRMAIEKFSRPLPVDISELKEQVSRPWSWFSYSTFPKEK